jgi:uncharacterized protein YceH (UPF0502 family)
MDLNPVELRILGCLMEKQRTTPDAYPLSLNSLRLACNQSTNRHPVVDYGEDVIRDALTTLTRRGYARLTSGAGSRVSKYRHLLAENLRVSDGEQALLGVLMLRGPQTVGELKLRTERWHPFADLDEVELTLEELAERNMVTRLQRRPGQKEERFAQLLGAEIDEDAIVAGAPSPEDAPLLADPLEERVAELERQVAELRAAIGLEAEPAPAEEPVEDDTQAEAADSAFAPPESRSDPGVTHYG